MIKKIVIVIFAALFFLGCSKESELEAMADFEFEIENEDYSVPVWVNFSNKSSGAETYNWTFEGGNPSIFEGPNPGRVAYNTPGTYQIVLEVANKDGGKDIKSATIKIDSALQLQYQVRWQNDSFMPAVLIIENLTKGSDTYSWTFAGGTPATSLDKHPSAVVFNQEGTHVISLKITNGRETFSKDTVVLVAPPLASIFEYLHDVGNEGWQAPISLHMQNQSISATRYEWSVIGGSAQISNPQEANPSIKFTQPGTYTIRLSASNGKVTEVATQQITVTTNTNLRVLEDVKLGINTASNTIGSYFSTHHKKVFPSDSLQRYGAAIDFAFYGLNSSFAYNRFVAADQTLAFGLQPVPNANGHCQIINSQELSNSNAMITATMFDNMMDDAVLRNLSITEDVPGLVQFDNTQVPRIVLFKTATGIKGAIKIKAFVPNGMQSYLLVDIKYMKSN